MLELVAPDLSNFLDTVDAIAYPADVASLKSRLVVRGIRQDAPLDLQRSLTGYGEQPPLALKAAYRIAGPRKLVEDLLDKEPTLFSLLVCMHLDEGARPLLHILVEECIPQAIKLAKSSPLEHPDDDVLEGLVDKTALALHRYRALTGIDLTCKTKSDFWDKVRSWRMAII